MLVIRMQRVGRSGHAQFRVIVQDSRQSPKSGKFVARLGSYDPHTKKSQLDKAKAELFIKNGAQPSERAAALFKQEGVKLPDWVKIDNKKSGALRNPDKLRKNRPAGSEEPKPAAEAEAATAPADSDKLAEAEAAAEEPAETLPEATETASDSTVETIETTEQSVESDATKEAQPDEPTQKAVEADEAAKPEPEDDAKTPPAETDAKD